MAIFTGTYYLRVRLTDSGDTVYELDLTTYPEPSITGNQTLSGSLSNSDEDNPTRPGRYKDDYFLTDVYPGQQLQIDLTKVILVSTNLDPYLQLINAITGEVIAYDDDGGGVPNSRLIFTVQQNVDYLIRVTSYASEEEGSYILTVQPKSNTPVVPDNAGNTMSSARELGTLSGSQTYSDWVGSTDTNDYYRFSVGSETILSLSLTGLSADADVELLNSSGTLIKKSTLSGTLNESITPNPTLSAGTYYIRVYPYGSVSTNYNLSLIVPSGNQVTFYEHDQYLGNSRTLGEVSLSSLDSSWDNKISSMYIPSGWIVEVFEHDNFQGQSKVFNSTTSYIGDDWNDKISSLKIYQTQPDYIGTSIISGNSYEWKISRFDENGKTKLWINPDKPTIVVAHGRVYETTGSINDLEQLAETAANVFGNDVQVLFLDWRNASVDSQLVPYEAGKRIGTVANDVANALRSFGLTDPNNLYFYGHSLGSHLLTKVAEEYGKVANFVSLDPAYPAEEYDLNNNGWSGVFEDELPDLKDIATNSIAFVAEDLESFGVAGDNNYATTAQRCYVVDFQGCTLSLLDTSERAALGHVAVVDTFNGILNKLKWNYLSLATDPVIKDNQWDNYGNPEGGDSDGVVRVLFENDNKDLYIARIDFLDSQNNVRNVPIDQKFVNS